MSEREIATVIARLDALDRNLTTGLQEIKARQDEHSKRISGNERKTSYQSGMLAALALGLPFIILALQQLL